MIQEHQKTCEERIQEHYAGRMDALRRVWALYLKDPEANDEEYGTFNEFGLAFDYVSPGTFKGQRRGYFRYQLSWGGPSDEFRFYCDENLNPVKISYWFLDWFDGAHIDLTGENYKLMEEIFLELKEFGTIAEAFESRLA